MGWRRPSTVAVLAVAFVVAMTALTWAVVGQGRRGDRLIEQRRMDVINDCVRERNDGRQYQLLKDGIAALTTADELEQDRLIGVLSRPARPADEVLAEDFAWCERRVDESPAAGSSR